MKRFKVLHVVMAKVWGGGEEYVYNLCNELCRQGHITFVVVDESNFLMKKRYAEVATVLTGNLYFAAGILSLNEIKNKIIYNDIDIINCHSGHGAFLCLLLKLLTGKKMVLFKHNALLSKHDIYHKWLIKNTDAIICVSKLVWNLQTQGMSTGDKNKFYLVYNGINLNKFNKYNKQHKNKDEFVIGYAGRIAENKGIDILINAFALFHEKYKNTKLKIVGADQKKYLNQIYYLVEQLGLGEAVCYCGIEKDMEKFYKSLDVFILPSVVREAFGLVICEAMYCGIPVITTDSGAQNEIIDDEKNGIIVPTENVEVLYDELKKLYEDDEKRKFLGKMAKKKVEKNFNISNCVNGVLKCYDIIC